MANEKTALEQTLLDILEHHKGIKNAVTVRELERMTGFSSRLIRKAAASLVTKHKVPIASSVRRPFGLYLIAEKEEGLSCIRQYRSRIREVSERASVLGKAIEKRFNPSGQKELDLHEDLQPPT